MTDITLTPITTLVVVRAGGAVIAESRGTLELREEGYAPVYYLPREDALTFCDPSDKMTKCPHKGTASYFHVNTKSGPLENAAWSYQTPIDAVGDIAGRVAFAHPKVTVELV